jgi:hypothetical protein
MNAKLKGILYGIAAVLLLSTVWWVMHRRDTKRDAAINSPLLRPEDNAKIIVDPRRHTIVTVTRDGTKATFLPRSGASVTIGKSGEVRTNTRTFGTEVCPFVGGAFEWISSSGRLWD